MRATVMYGAGDVRVEDVPDSVLKKPTDALVRITASCICGSDLHPYGSMSPADGPARMGHEFIGVVEDTGSEVTTRARTAWSCSPHGRRPRRPRPTPRRPSVTRRTAPWTSAATDDSALRIPYGGVARARRRRAVHRPRRTLTYVEALICQKHWVVGQEGPHS